MYRELVKDIVSYKNHYSRERVLVCTFNEELSERVGDNSIYISEFVIAKVLGYIKHLQGHPEVTKSFLIDLPNLLKSPKEILMNTYRPNERYIICGSPYHRVVLEIKRNNQVTEINTIHRIGEGNLRRLENKCKKL